MLEENLAVKKTELRKQVHANGLPQARLWGHAYPGWILSEGPGFGPSDKGEPGGCTGTWGPNHEPCGMACMPLSLFCHECILNDPAQVHRSSTPSIPPATFVLTALLPVAHLPVNRH